MKSRYRSDDGSDMALQSLWWTSLLLILASLSAISALVILRTAREIAGRRDIARDNDLRRQIVSVMEGGQVDLAPRAHSGVKPVHEARVLLQSMALVRGNERDLVVAAFLASGLDQRLRQSLSRTGHKNIREAIEALALFPSSRTASALLGIFSSTADAQVRAAALQSLYVIGADPPLAQVVRTLAVARSGSLVLQSILARLAEGHPDEAAVVLRSRIGRPADRGALARGLGRSGLHEALPNLINLLNDEEPIVRMGAVNGLGSLGHPSAGGPVMRSLLDSDWKVRAEACDAIGRIGLTGLADDLAGAMTDPVWWVRFRAAEALVTLGPIGLARLSQAARIPGTLQRTAQQALAELEAA